MQELHGCHFVLCCNVLSEHLRTQQALGASQPDARGPGRSLTEVALATPVYSSAGVDVVSHFEDDDDNDDDVF